MIWYVGGEDEQTEWIYTCSKRMRPSADKLWNAVIYRSALARVRHFEDSQAVKARYLPWLSGKGLSTISKSSHVAWKWMVCA